MRLITTFIVFLFSFISFGQSFELESDTHPYYDVIEWKGFGALLLSKDPRANTKQIEITLVNDQKTSVWDQKFNPKNEEFFYISSDNARYVYFIDNLELIQGKAYFSQLNSAGNIKSTNVNFGTPLKRFGVSDYNDIQIDDIVVTDKALVYMAHVDNKKDKARKDFAIMVTHHNMLVYVVELGATLFADQKDENISNWNYIGFTGDKIYFASHGYSAKQTGWSVKCYSSKGKPLTSTFLKSPKNAVTINNIGFGTTGKHYLKKQPPNEKGLLAQINGNYYLVGGSTEGQGARITLSKFEESNWKKIQSINLNYFIEKKPLNLGIYPLNEGIAYHLDHNGYNKASVLFFDGKKPEAHNDFEEKMIYNPSSAIYPKKSNEFCTGFNLGVLYFDKGQLTAKKVKFEIRK